MKYTVTKLAKTSTLLIILTCLTWIFNFNANNCLNRDFVTSPYPAFCWRQVNDYESTIDYSWWLLHILLVLTIVCVSVMISKRLIKQSKSSPKENRKTAWFLAALSSLLLIFIITTLRVWQSTIYNNNNYALNDASNLVVIIGIPAWLILTTAAITYALNSRHKKLK
jgi:magnesium-transporting ATPase (P-type)